MSQLFRIKSNVAKCHDRKQMLHVLNYFVKCSGLVFQGEISDVLENFKSYLIRITKQLQYFSEQLLWKSAEMLQKMCLQFSGRSTRHAHFHPRARTRLAAAGRGAELDA